MRFILSRITALFTPAFTWWKPITISPLLGINMNYRSIFRTLRFIPHGHGIPLKVKPQPPLAENPPYAHFFNVYKPNTQYKKTNPPVPDFAISVVSARTTRMPSLVEFAALFDVLPEVPPPMPRVRQKLPANSGNDKSQEKKSQGPRYQGQGQGSINTLDVYLAVSRVAIRQADHSAVSETNPRKASPSDGCGQTGKEGGHNRRGGCRFPKFLQVWARGIFRMADSRVMV